MQSSFYKLYYSKYCEKSRRKGIARRMIEFLVDEAKERGVTEISLDATDDGRKLYEAMGWQKNSETMVKDL